jgi:hypothetical protein
MYVFPAVAGHKIVLIPFDATASEEAVIGKLAVEALAFKIVFLEDVNDRVAHDDNAIRITPLRYSLLLVLIEVCVDDI